jgi:hypothetical protein
VQRRSIGEEELSQFLLLTVKKATDMVDDPSPIGKDVYRIRLSVTPVKQDNAAKDTTLGPIPNTISYALRVLIVVSIPRVAKESSRKGWRIELLGVLRRAPPAEGVIFMLASILGIEPSSILVDGSSNKLYKPGREARGS